MSNEKCTEISFYIVAHADDWQLFMQPNAYNNLIATHSKVVFIITTAGDAGFDKTYWNAREEGLKSSLRFCLRPIATLQESSGTKKFNAHNIYYYSINNATSYFLRLPDGNLDGNGFSTNNFHSLPKFKAGDINALTAEDNSATYYNWADFYTTLQTIILAESDGISNILINYLNPDTSKNPNDHSDHIATGHAIQSMTNISNFQRALYVGYNLCNNHKKLDATDLFWKAGMFAAYEKAVFDGSGYSTLHEGIDIYLQWCLSGSNYIIVNP